NHEAPMLAASKNDFVNDARLYAQQHLAEIEAAAHDAGVRCDTLAVNGERPHEVIIKTAHEQDCDLIAMASHGRRGAKAAMLGSETQKALVYSHLPVLVYRYFQTAPALYPGMQGMLQPNTTCSAACASRRA